MPCTIGNARVPACYAWPCVCVGWGLMLPTCSVVEVVRVVEVVEVVEGVVGGLRVEW